jgi:hypothetical protein
MPKEPRKMQSWQVLHYARKHLGKGALCSIFGKKNSRAVEYWCEDPRFTAKPEGAYDPIQGVRNLLEVLDDLGHCSVVRACISYLCQGTSADCGVVPEVTDTKPTMAEEVLADYQAIAKMQHAIEEHASTEVVYSLKLDAIDEVERTFAKYLETHGVN